MNKYDEFTLVDVFVVERSISNANANLRCSGNQLWLDVEDFRHNGVVETLIGEAKVKFQSFIMSYNIPAKRQNSDRHRDPQR